MAATATIASKEIALSHGRTRYLEAGTGHPVILLHGAGIAGGADDYRPAIELLSQKYRVLAPDFPNWPPGDPKTNMQAFPGMTDFLREFQDALGLKSSHIVGATMGGWIAGLLAYESPNRVDKLVMTGNPGFHGSANNNLASWNPPTDDKIEAAVALVTPALSDSERNSLTQEKKRLINDPDYAEAFRSMMSTMGNPQNRKEFNLLRRMPHITSPTLLLLGRGDPSSKTADELQALIPGSKLVIIEDGAHQVHYENTEQFSKVITEFLG